MLKCRLYLHQKTHTHKHASSSVTHTDTSTHIQVGKRPQILPLITPRLGMYFFSFLFLVSQWRGLAFFVPKQQKQKSDQKAGGEARPKRSLHILDGGCMSLCRPCSCVIRCVAFTVHTDLPYNYYNVELVKLSRGGVRSLGLYRLGLINASGG